MPLCLEQGKMPKSGPLHKSLGFRIVVSNADKVKGLQRCVRASMDSTSSLKGLYTKVWDLQWQLSKSACRSEDPKRGIT